MTDTTPSEATASRPTETKRSLVRDEVRVATGETEQLLGGDIWVELSEPVTPPIDKSLGELPVNDVFEIIDLPTDAVRVAVISEKRPSGEAPRADYDHQEFRSKTEQGLIIPASMTNPTEDVDYEKVYDEC